MMLNLSSGPGNPSSMSGRNMRAFSSNEVRPGNAGKSHIGIISYKKHLTISPPIPAPYGGGGSSSGRAIGYQPGDPRLDSQSGPSQIIIATCVHPALNG
ncbi:hypothetical protein PoB_005960000 [Plakobranchus ocellatus]|uniref:Uncharacterized protein n=1 Tax=Plakobranchus ocellatus TaxID=259542 RepID=A0AAV4CM15_9GAST|nr:hypothetical protein PoB_005960000 [Plakobranchus ocellatus]